MIVILPATKDTYVTNLNTQNVDATKSNVGHAATLDLFKLYNENKNAKSSAVLKFNTNGNVAADGNQFTLIDTKGNSVTFEVDTGVPTLDGSLNGNNNVIIGLVGLGISDYANAFKTVINNVSSFNNNLTLEINAYENSNNELILKQINSGPSGDTTITIPNGINYVSVSSNNSNSFSRKESSFIMIKFDFQKFKDDFMQNVVFVGSAFDDSNFKAEIILYDVTTGHSKPRDYTIEAYNMLKDFDEGIGKDTIHFSDINETSNFINLNNTEDWQIPGYVSFSSDISTLDHPLDGSEVNPSFNVVKGDENLIIDITDYFSNQIQGNVDHKGVLIKLSDADFNDEKTYFVKRFGSRHLLNKSLVPVLKISIPDHSFTIPKKTQFTKRFLNHEETFYLFSRGSGLNQFQSPGVGYDLRLRILSEDKATTFVDDIATSDCTNYKGITLNSVKKAEIANTRLSRFDANISAKIKNNKLVTYIVWYWDDNTNEHVVLEEKVIFSLLETSNDKTYSNLVSRVKFENTRMNGDNTINEGHVYFLDTRESLDVVKVPFEILSENVGTVKYQLVNVETNKVLYDYSDSTELFYDGEKYVFNFCIPEIYKKLRVKFNFKVTSQINQNEYIIKNKEIFRIE